MDHKYPKSAHQTINRIWLLLIPAIGLIFMLLPEEYQQHLYLYLELAQQGEVWRLLSGHFIYVSWLHWMLNSAGIFLLWLFFRENLDIRTWLPALIFILAIISTGLMVLSVKLVWYAGFSGILTGLFAYGAITGFVKNSVFSAGLLIFITVYVFIQLSSGELVHGGLTSVQTSSYAHAFGWIAGIVYGLLTIIAGYLIKARQ